jgi:hypothetical protein
MTIRKIKIYFRFFSESIGNNSVSTRNIFYKIIEQNKHFFDVVTDSKIADIKIVVDQYNTWNQFYSRDEIVLFHKFEYEEAKRIILSEVQNFILKDKISPKNNKKIINKKILLLL